MLVIVTRAQPGADETAARLTRLGYTAIVSPALTITPIPETRLPDVQESDGLVFTSANGVRAFAEICRMRMVTAYCVGPATAAAAKAAGFEDIRNADGDSGDLADLIRAQVSNKAGRFLHIANEAAAGALVDDLRLAGFETLFLALYRAEPAPALAPPARDMILRRDAGAVLIHSAKGAEAFGGLCREMDVDLQRFGVAAVSERAAAPLIGLSPWQIEIAERPNETALLEALGRVSPPL